MKKILTAVLLLAVMSLNAQKAILLNNVEVFNGKDEKTIVMRLLKFHGKGNSTSILADGWNQHG